MTYRIIDEPAPSGLERAIVNPVWPFFAAMFAGGWLSLPWFAFNAFALGGRQRYTDIAIVVGGVLLNGAVVLGLWQLLESNILGLHGGAYAMLLPIGVRLVVVYVLYQRQERVFELFTYFGGLARNGLPLVIVGGILRSRILGELPVPLQVLLG